MFKSLSKKIAIDLGSRRIRIVAIDDLQNDIWELSPIDFRSKILEEEACLARRKDDHKLLAVGREALAMQGRLDSFAEIVFPFNKSRVMDQEAASVLMKELLKRVFKGLVLNPMVMVTTAPEATILERKILSQFFYELGFADVNLIAAPLAAGVGAGVPIADTSGSLFLQMGAAGISLSVIAMGSLLFNENSNFGGDRLNAEIIDHLALRENFIISLESAERIKQQVFSLVPTGKSASKSIKRSLLVVGKTADELSPMELSIKASDLEPIAELFRREYKILVQVLLAKIPPDLVADALRKGLLLSGGLAQLIGLEDFLIAEFAMPVALLDAPDLLASLGATAMLSARL